MNDQNNVQGCQLSLKELQEMISVLYFLILCDASHIKYIDFLTFQGKSISKRDYLICFRIFRGAYVSGNETNVKTNTQFSSGFASR